MLYIILSYFILGTLFAVYYMYIEATNTGPFSGSANTQKYKDIPPGFDREYTPLFIILWVVSPLSLPLVLIIWLSHYAGTRIYDRWFKPIS